MTKSQEKSATEIALEEFFAKGGSIQQLKPNQSGVRKMVLP